jgi:hypothetical protein
VQFIAANILRLAAAGADIAGLDSALITKVAKVRALLDLQLIVLQESDRTFNFSIKSQIEAKSDAVL